MLKIIFVIFFAAQTCFAGTSKANPQKIAIPNILEIAVAYNNASADVESLLNIISVTSNNSQYVEQFKQHLGPKNLKQKTLKFRRTTDDTFVAGKNTLTMVNGKIQINGKVFAFDSSKNLLKNFKKFQADFGGKNKTSLFEVLVPQAHAKNEDEAEIDPIIPLFLGSTAATFIIAEFGGGSVSGLMVTAAASAAGAAVAGAAVFAFSGEATASESHVPISLCHKKGSVFRNTTAHVSGDIFTQELESKDGQLIVTEKINGDIGEVLTIDKKGETFEVIKILSNGKSVEPSTHPLGKLGVYYSNAYKVCVKPTKEESEQIAKINQIGADAQKGKIKLFAEGSKGNRAIIEKSGVR